MKASGLYLICALLSTTFLFFIAFWLKHIAEHMK